MSRPSHAAPSGPSPVLVVVALGLVAGMVELADVGWRRYVDHELIWRSWQTMWLTPLSAVLVCLPAGLVLAGFRRVLPRLLTPARVAWLAAFPPVFFGVWQFFPRIAAWAVLVLAVGITTQAARLLTSRPVAAGRVQRLALAAAVVLVACGAAANGLGTLAERRRLAALPPAPPRARNILLLVLDTVRGVSLSLFGYGRTTSPHLDALARRGLNFRAAFSTSPWTLPAHVALFTGLYTHEGDGDWRHPFTVPDPTIAEVLRDRGYATAGFSGNVAYVSRETGLGRGFVHFEDYGATLAELAVASSAGRFVVLNPRLRRLVGYHDIVGRKSATDVNAALLRWLPARRGRPFFAFVNYYDAHEPYLPPPPYDTLFGPRGPRDLGATVQRMRLAFPPGRDRMSPAEQAAEQRAYDGAIAFLDRAIGDLLGALAERGLLDSTVVIVTSDHGEQFGEHGLFVHGNSLYAPNLHVPLIVVEPGMRRTGVVDRPVTLRDIPATVAALAGASDAPFPGRSLLDSARAVSPVLAEVTPLAGSAPFPRLQGRLRSLVDDSRHWILNADATEELYDWRADPAEIRDLAAEPGAAPTRAAFGARLDSLFRVPKRR